MPVDTPSLFSRIIQEHLELKRRNAALDQEMPLARYMEDDPFSNHPLFKSEEQARLEDTMDGVEGPSAADVTALLGLANEDTAEHEALPPQAAAAAPAAETAVPDVDATQADVLAAPPGPAPGMLPAQAADEAAWGRSRDFDWGD